MTTRKQATERAQRRKASRISTLTAAYYERAARFYRGLAECERLAPGSRARFRALMRMGGRSRAMVTALSAWQAEVARRG